VLRRGTAITSDDERSSTVEAAIARVLAAERAAREAVAQAREEAEHIAEAARASVRALEARTDRRIRLVRDAFQRRLGEALGALAPEDAPAASQPAPDAREQARLDEAIEALARRLTGGES